MNEMNTFIHIYRLCPRFAPALSPLCPRYPIRPQPAPLLDSLLYVPVSPPFSGKWFRGKSLFWKKETGRPPRAGAKRPPTWGGWGRQNIAGAAVRAQGTGRSGRVGCWRSFEARAGHRVDELRRCAAPGERRCCRCAVDRSGLPTTASGGRVRRCRCCGGRRRAPCCVRGARAGVR